MKKKNYFSPDVQFVDVLIERGFVISTPVDKWGEGGSYEGGAE